VGVSQPLAGRRVVVTRPRAQAAGLADKLAAAGAQPILFPTIEIALAEDAAPLQAALRRLDEYDWLVFTSANGVAAVRARLGGALPAALRVAAVGPATARALEKIGAAAAFIPDEYIGDSLATGLEVVAGQRVLLPQGELTDGSLARSLRLRGAIVDEVVAYRTLPAAPDPDGLAELRRGVDALTFTSGSAARNFVTLVGLDAAAPRATVAVIGPATAAAAREAGLVVAVVAEEHTLEGLVGALQDYFDGARGMT
jgi:uroporphyrinogen-III synthase